MKILLWGIYSPWTMNFIENFLLKNDYEIWMLNRGRKKEYKKYIDFYRKNGIHLIEIPPIVSEVFDNKDKWNSYESWYSHFLMLKEVVKAGPFNLINMQYVECSDLLDVILLKYIMRTSLVLSYWGSELLREEENRLNFMGKFIRCADFITFDNADLKIKFKEIYKWANKKMAKTVLLGLPVLEIINRKCRGEAGADIRKKWGIPENKLVIAVGYNGIPEQQHKRVLGVIESLEAKYKEKIVLLLQMSYGGTKQYKDSVVAAVKRTGCEYMDIQRFLSNEEVAELRILTDIFINAQVTDAFSGSVCENLFADTLVINAKWLHYKELDRYGFQYIEFERFDDIKGIIKTVFGQKPDVSRNKELIWRLRSWECCGPRWRKVYKRVCKHV